MRISLSIITAALFLSLTLPAAAQSEPRVIGGTITAVNGNQVTIQRPTGTIVVNDQPALDQQATGDVAVGRQVLARGSWQNGTFFATSFADADVYGYAGYNGPGQGIGRLRGAVHGTITAVSGHLVTIRGSGNSIVINDQPALNHKLTGSVSVGRDIVATGYWSDGTFYATNIVDASNGPSDAQEPNFGAFTRIPDSISGTITRVNGNQVILQQSARSVVVNDQPALDHHETGNVATGRQVIANGYWLHGIFYATSFTDAAG